MPPKAIRMSRPVLSRFFFRACLGLGLIALVQQLSYYRNSVVPGVAEGLARAVAALSNLLGVEAASVHTFVVHVTSRSSLEITPECTALAAAATVAAAIWALPASTRFRAAAIVAAVGAIQAVNVARLTHLYLLATQDLARFEFAHAALWPPVNVAVVLAAFLLPARHCLGAGARRQNGGAAGVGPRPGERVRPVLAGLLLAWTTLGFALGSGPPGGGGGGGAQAPFLPLDAGTPIFWLAAAAGIWLVLRRQA